MLSVTIYTIIFAAIAYLVAFLKRKNKVEDYSIFTVISIVLMSRVFPYLMLEEKTNVLYIGFFLEIVLYIYIFVMENEFASKAVRPVFVWCLIQPCSLLASLAGSQRGLIASLSLLIIIIHLHFYQRHIARKSRGKAKEDLPQPVSKNTASKKAKSRFTLNEAPHRESLRRVDYVLLIVVMLIYGIFIFHNIGTSEAPETERLMNISDGTNEITLDLGESIYVSKIWVWLGYQNTRCAYSWYSFEEPGWVIMDGDYNIDGVFRWHSFEANQSMQHIGMVFQTEPVVINEIVVVDGWGNVILPANAGNYPELFDEQDKFVDSQLYYNNSMFDEVYHARTAYEFIYDYPIYEYTHPPLGKSIISLGIRIFGMNPFGWRFMSGVFGILLVPLSFAFAYELTGKRRDTILTTILMCAGFMNYTLSRIATIDIFVAVFAMGMLYFMLSYVRNLASGVINRKQIIRLALSGVFTGLAIATKWTGIYAGVGIAIILFYGLYNHYIRSDRRNMLKELRSLALVCTLLFVLVPLIIYTISYIEFVQVNPENGLIKTTIDNISLMLNYHNGVKSSHPYQSEWYQWIINYRPLLDACNYVGTDTYTVSTFINPLICIGGIVAVIYSACRWRVKSDTTAGCLVIAYLSMLMPWLLVHRTVFIYQYFISMLIMILMIGYAFKCIVEEHPWAIYAFAGFVLVAVCLFGYFYPIISGEPISYEYVNEHMEWLESWVFA